MNDRELDIAIAEKLFGITKIFTPSDYADYSSAALHIYRFFYSTNKCNAGPVFQLWAHCLSVHISGTLLSAFFTIYQRINHR